MGVNTTAKLRGIVNINSLKNQIEKYRKVVSVHPSSETTASIIIQAHEYNRNMFVLYNHAKDYTYISLSYNPQAISIIRPLAEFFGGEYEENDCSDEPPVLYDGVEPVRVITPTEKILFNAGKISTQFESLIMGFIESNAEDIKKLITP